MKKYFIIIITTFITCLGLSIFFARPKSQDENFSYPTEVLKINLEGAVIFPKHYEVPTGTRLRELIDLAGGLSKDADLTKVNLNDVLSTSKTITIPYLPNYVKQKVNINTAKFEVLISVPYITEQKAASIIIYRQTNGYFKRIEDIINVKYIGNATFDKIKDYITI
jgi:competence protein ComEA